MVQSAIEEYGFHDDDYLMDTISSFSSLGCSFGEIIGPIFAGFITDFLGIENCCLIASAMGLVFAVVYFFGTGYAWSLCRRSKDEALIVKKKVVPENISMQRDILREV
jgi:MFS family permease